MRGGCKAVLMLLGRRRLVSRAMGRVVAGRGRIFRMATLMVHGRAIIMVGCLASPVVVARRFALVGWLWLPGIGWLVSGVELWRAVARFSTSVCMLPGFSLSLVGASLPVSLQSVSVIKRIMSLRSAI